MMANNPRGNNGYHHGARKVRLSKYQRAMPMVVELLKKKDVPMSVGEIHDALIWYWDMGIIRRAVRELLADGTIAQGFVTIGSETRPILRMALPGQWYVMKKENGIYHTLELVKREDGGKC